MSSHADLIQDYYHIIDPNGWLSEVAKIQKADKILNEMPVSFPDALEYVMGIAGITREVLAFKSNVSVATIGRYRSGKTTRYSEKTVIALCIGMHLPPWLSCILVEKAGFRLSETSEQRVYMTILDCIGCPIFVTNILKLMIWRRNTKKHIAKN